MPYAGLNTSGFQVNTMPVTPAIDPRLYAADPSQFSSGALDATKVLGAFAALKQQKDQMAEQALTRDARVANTKALSDLNVMQADALRQTQPEQIASTLQDLQLKQSQTADTIKNLPFQQQLAVLQRQGETLKAQGFLDNYEKNLKLQSELTASEADKNRAMADNYRADALKAKAAARAAGIPEDKAFEAWEKSVGELAGITGATPAMVKKLYDSQQLNENGIPLSAELAAMAENLKKPEFWKDPYETASNTLKQWLGKDTLDKIKEVGQVKQINQAVKDQRAGAPAEGTSNTPKTIKIDANGNITSPGQAAGATAPAPQAQATAPAGKSASNALETTGLLSAAALASPTVRAKLGQGIQGLEKLGTRLWNGRSAAGKFTGKALKTLPKRDLSAFLRGGVGSALGPVTAAYAGNQAIGSLLSDKDTGDLTALEGIALGATAPSFDEQQREARYDELSSRIGAVMRSANLSDEKKNEELETLLAERDLMWSLMQRGDEQ